MSIRDKYNEFVNTYSKEPKYLEASVMWKDTEETVDGLVFSLSNDYDDDHVFFSTKGINDIEAMTYSDNGEDFVILEDTIRFY